jgi:hypothetical protein
MASSCRRWIIAAVGLGVGPCDGPGNVLDRAGSGGRQTEIESLNGYVARRAVELGVAAPVNQALRALVRLAEG